MEKNTVTKIGFIHLKLTFHLSHTLEFFSVLLCYILALFQLLDGVVGLI